MSFNLIKNCNNLPNLLEIYNWSRETSLHVR